MVAVSTLEKCMSKELDHAVVDLGFGTGKTTMMMHSMLLRAIEERRPARVIANAARVAGQTESVTKE